MTQTATPEVDPLETYESVPAISFHAPNGGYAKGAWAKLTVRDWPKLLEQKDEDGQIERWDNGDAKLVLVVPVTDEEGTEKNLWAKKFGKKAPASIYQQLAAAQKKVREETGNPAYRLGPGDTVALMFVDEDKSVKAIKGNYPKMYKAVIRPGARPAPSGDPFDEGGAGTEGNQAESDPWATPAADAAEAPQAATPAAAAHTTVGGDPFGPADAGEDEPPF